MIFDLPWLPFDKSASQIDPRCCFHDFSFSRRIDEKSEFARVRLAISFSCAKVPSPRRVLMTPAPNFLQDARLVKRQIEIALELNIGD